MENIQYLFDGGMGTYFAEKCHIAGLSCEYANTSHPELIQEIHREYLEAGCNALKTNTFAINRLQMGFDEHLASALIKAAWNNVRAASKDYEAAVFADIGPITMIQKEVDVFEEYRWIVDQFIALGADRFIFETLANTEGLEEIADYIKEKLPESFIITSFAVMPDGFTRDGIMVGDLYQTVRQNANIDAFGLNCVCGARHMLELSGELDHEDMILAMMPNAGYPTVIQNRTYYDGDPHYYADQMAIMASEGIRILGGCCGTTPVHIRMTRQALAGTSKAEEQKNKSKTVMVSEDRLESHFWNKLNNREKVIAVELDSPMNTNLNKFMSGTWALKDAGCDIITIADCPIARARMDSSLLACKLKRELGIDALPHMTCRDRNLNATKALLLGLYAEGIRNLLLITGDPIPTAERDEVKSVYQFNSRKLAGFVKSLGQKVLPGEFHMFGALNVNALNFDVQLKIAKEKEAKGMIGFLTQPILTQQALDNLKLAKQELKGFILGGIMPVVSARNARFMNSEINGINVAQEIIQMYEGKDREAGEQLAIELSVKIMKDIEPYVDGFYLMTPFGRTGLICDIIHAYQA